MFFLSSGCLRIISRCNTRHLFTSVALTYDHYGEPEDVLSLSERSLSGPLDDEVMVKMCAAPIHPSDINTMQGVYPIKPPLPAVAGNEGVGKVVTIGRNVKDFAVGDFVVPTKVSSGTWQTRLCAKANCFYRIQKPMSISHAAIVRTNPGTALRMLSDFVQLQSDDVVVQNGATSAVGIYVIQLAKLLGYKTINLFRARSTTEATEQTRQLLLDYGANWALTEAEFADKDHPVARTAKDSGPIKLALNCLGGKPAIVLLKALENNGILVSYGAMTRNPMSVPVGPLIFRNLQLRGFWISSWIQTEQQSRVHLMYDQLVDLFSRDMLRPSPYVEIPFEDWSKAIELSKFGDSDPIGIRKKVILKME